MKPALEKYGDLIDIYPFLSLAPIPSKQLNVGVCVDLAFTAIYPWWPPPLPKALPQRKKYHQHRNIFDKQCINNKGADLSEMTLLD